ncbi:hypothetical protein IWW34DRAFT_191443 [Fusarium oxysporum f. sp. albedinis]|nr:hypothetical protein IWW34DRAFT_191443 [Fusarium oxysporum f. sp. albedinis]
MIRDQLSCHELPSKGQHFQNKRELRFASSIKPCSESSYIIQDTLISFNCLMKHVVIITKTRLGPPLAKTLMLVMVCRDDYGFPISRVLDMTKVLMTANLQGGEVFGDRENEMENYIISHNSALTLASHTRVRRRRRFNNLTGCPVHTSAKSCLKHHTGHMYEGTECRRLCKYFDFEEFRLDSPGFLQLPFTSRYDSRDNKTDYRRSTSASSHVPFTSSSNLNSTQHLFWPHPISPSS